MSASVTEKLKRRKLDALKRGIHRLNEGETLRVSSHVVGIGKSGAGVVTEILDTLDADGPAFSALVIDIGDHDLAELRAVANATPPGRANIRIVSLEVPDREALVEGLRGYPDFLKLEYPQYYWGESYSPWLAPDASMPTPGGAVDRAVAKAIYGLAYYSGKRMLRQMLREFAASVEGSDAQAVVAIVFGLGGGTGSGIAVDLARHLSVGLFGRRVLVAGIGIAPCDGDAPARRDARLYPVLNELDCLGDEAKNQGVVASCGELFRNPFTAGFLLVPQQHVWDSCHDLPLTQARGNREIATLLAGRGGIELWQTLRLLNWVAAPSTQHSAARTPWGRSWIHMLGFVDASDAPLHAGADLAARLGLLPSYVPEFIEARCGDGIDRTGVAARLEAAFHPDVPPQIVVGGAAGSIQFILPSVAKTDLVVFAAARAEYDQTPAGARLLEHALLLERGVLLSDPSERLAGMAGAALGASEGWVAVSMRDLRGEAASPASGAPELVRFA